MFSHKHYINYVSLLLISLIGFLFVYKYASIYLNSPLILSSVYFILFFFIIFFIGSLKREILFFRKKNFIYLWIVISALVFIVITFTPRIGEIGRYPAIVDWLERFLRGDFPYNSPHTPSAFPFLFFFSLPLYLIGNIGYLELIGILIFAALAVYYSKSGKENILKIILLLGSPVLYYFVFVRCELFTNMLLIIGLIYLFERYGNSQKINSRFILLAIGAGLLLSTRSVAAVIYVIYFLYYFRNNIPHLIIFTVIVIAVFLSLLIPFYLWDKESFLSNGPFAVQSFLSYLPMWFIILLLLLSVYIGWMISDIQEVFFACGTMLFIPVFVSMLIKVFEFGFNEAIINDLFDHSYYEFALPFFILAIKDYKIDKYLGKLHSDASV